MNRREQILNLFKFCMCNQSLCAECPNLKQDIVKCKDLNTEAFDIINELLEENEALRADLEKMAKTRSDCSVCDHYNIDGPRPDCELNGWHCEWKWRGVEKYKKEELFE